MNKTGNDTAGSADEAAPTTKGLGLSLAQLIAGGGAAAVASVIGGRLGLAGTVVGAFILSVVSGIALPLFRASLEKSHEQIKRVVPRRATNTAEATRSPITADTAGIVSGTSGTVSVTPTPLEQPLDVLAATRQARTAPGSRKAGMLIGGTAAIFVLGVGSILGIQSATGVALSHGTGVLQSGVSQVVPIIKGNTSLPATDPSPSAPAVDPSTAPTDPATDPATGPTDQPAPTPTPPSDPVPTAEPTAPAGGDQPAPSSVPVPDAGTPGGSSGADGTAGQAQPGAGTPADGAPAK